MVLLKALGLIFGTLTGWLIGFMMVGCPWFPPAVSKAIGWMIAVDAVCPLLSYIWPVLWFRQSEPPPPPIRTGRVRYL